MELREAESKGVRAVGYEAGDGFVIQADSFAVGDSAVQSSLAEKPSRVSLRRELIASGKLFAVDHRYQFAEDVAFNSPSEAASVVWGSNLNGRKVFGLDESDATSDPLPGFVRY
jgi:Domain of unknown function (DUF4357)